MPLAVVRRFALAEVLQVHELLIDIGDLPLIVCRVACEPKRYIARLLASKMSVSALLLVSPTTEIPCRCAGEILRWSKLSSVSWHRPEARNPAIWPAAEGQNCIGDCAAAENAAKESQNNANESERGMTPPVSQVEGVTLLKSILTEKFQDRRRWNVACPNRHARVPGEWPRELLWAARCSGSSNKTCARGRKSWRTTLRPSKSYCEKLASHSPGEIRSVPA